MQKLPVIGFEWPWIYLYEFDEIFVKSYNAESDGGCLFEVDVQYPKNWYDLQNNLPILPEKNEKIKKFFANFFDKTECDSHKKFKTSIKS